MPRFWLTNVSISARHASIGSLLAVMSLLALAGYSQTPTKRDDQTTTGKTKPADTSKTGEPYRPTNPLLDTQTDKRTPTLESQNRLQDYTLRENPNIQRNPRSRTDGLKMFGYNFYEPARKAIEAHRSRLFSFGPNASNTRRIYDENSSNPRRRDTDASSRPLTQEERDAVAALTDAQKLDLLMRQREGLLTDTEKIKYRALLSPPQNDDNTTNNEPDNVDESDLLTDSQKLDLLQRQRDNRLSDDEKIRFFTFLYPEAARNRAQTNRTRSGSTTDKGRDSTTSDRTGQPGKAGTEGEADEGMHLQGTSRTAQGNRLGGLTTGNARARRGTQGNGIDDTGNNGKGNPVEGDEDTDTSLNNGRSNPGQRRNAGDNPPYSERASAYTDFVDPFAQFFSNPSFSVPLSYQLGGGDRITLRVSSPLMELRETTLLVDAQGAINVPDIGRLVVAGKTLAQAEAEITTLMQRQFRNARVSLSLKELRTMPVTISGEAYAPGTYQVPSVATAFNLLYATGGPTENGTMRRIQVLRRGKPIGDRTIDLYKFLLTGDQTSDITLEPGDTIYIPARETQVAVMGEVRRPAFYELLENESLKQALQFAGGIKPSGVAQRVQVSTIQPGSGRLLKDVDASNANVGPMVPLFDGDVVEVFSVRTTLTNVVTIEGAVDQPGQYAITPNMTVADLVERARGLLSEAYPGLAQLNRWNPDNTLSLIDINLEKALARDPAANLPLTRWDRLTILTRQDIAWTARREVTVRGAIKNPGIYYRSDNMKVRDLLITAGGTLPEAYLDEAYLLHQKPDKSFSYQYINLGAALRDDPQNNLLVQDRDTLAVYRADEARFTPLHVVDITGEVVTPGRYPRGENMKLSEVLKIAGGLTPRAGDRILVAHARQEENQQPLSIGVSPTDSKPAQDIVLQDGDLISIQGRGTFQETPYVVYVNGAVNRPGPVILRGPKVHLSEVIKEAGGLKSEGYAEGVEFFRSPSLLATGKQKQIADVINKLNDVLNQSDFKRKSALATVEELKAVGKVTQNSAPLAIPGLTTTTDTSPNPALASGANNLFTKELVTPARFLAPEDLQPKGNVAVNLAEAIRKPTSEDDVVMMDGDTITVPVRPTTVQVVGAVMQSRGVLFREGAKLDYYLDQAGGFAPDAAKDRILVIRVGGGLTPIKKVKAFMPGDLIFVPTEVLAVQINKRSTDFDSLFRSLTSSALIFFVAKKLLGF